MLDRSVILRLQRNVGTTVDGVMGRGTLTALFKRLGASTARAENLALAANVHFETFNIFSDPLVLAHFLGQAVHETGSFTYLEEIASGKAYEGRKDLGNTVPGYGVRFKGRGIFQLTGYANYVLYSRKAGIDLVTDPTRAVAPDLSLLIACYFWQSKDLSKYAKADNIIEVTRRINGGRNGLQDRIDQTNKVKRLLGLPVVKYKV